MNADTHPHLLILSGFDPCGGAGLIADIETVHALDCRTSAVITSQTIQTVHNVTACMPTDAAWLKDQLHSLIATYSFSAIKIGLTPSVEIIESVAAALSQSHCPVVIDPVIAASSGYEFCDAATVQCLSEKLIPLGDVATPNAQELKRLAGAAVDPVASLLERGCKAVLVSSEYESAEHLHHRLYRLQYPPSLFATKRLPYRYHGSGCTLASAIAAYLAHGKDLVSAIAYAQNFTERCLRTALPETRGVAIPRRFKQ